MEQNDEELLLSIRAEVQRKREANRKASIDKHHMRIKNAREKARQDAIPRYKKMMEKTRQPASDSESDSEPEPQPMGGAGLSDAELAAILAADPDFNGNAMDYVAQQRRAVAGVNSGRGAFRGSFRAGLPAGRHGAVRQKKGPAQRARPPPAPRQPVRMDPARALELLAQGVDIEVDYETLCMLEDVKVGLAPELQEKIHRFRWPQREGPGGVAKEGDDELICPVCQCEFEDGEEVAQPGCTHAFHWDCLSQWLKERKTCPVCKQDLSEELSEL